eukprot:1155493-Pelagomonas_calceolata.AAC.1
MLTASAISSCRCVSVWHASVLAMHALTDARRNLAESQYSQLAHSTAGSQLLRLTLKKVHSGCACRDPCRPSNRLRGSSSNSGNSSSKTEATTGLSPRRGQAT